jgi:hypothetical protein
MKRRYTRSELRELLGVVDEPRPEAAEAPAPDPARTADENFVVWSVARAEANLAYDAWCAAPGSEGYLVYRAAEDRADAAEAALAMACAA